LRIVLADDHDIVRAGLKSLLAQHTEWTVCGEAANGVEAVSKVVELTPDVVILDITMPVMSGLEAAVKIRRLAPGTRIVILSMHDAVVMEGLLTLSAPDAYVSKTTANDDLVRALNSIMQRQPSVPAQRLPAL
jgi:DNA-binding NarL/FixJ family response regulator